MKYSLTFLILTFWLMSCEEEVTDVELVGTFKLIETLSDPGDGSGKFRKISSDKTIEFMAD